VADRGRPGIADHLIDLEPRDRLIAFTFRRYAKVIGGAAQLHQGQAPSRC
jgi:hypothetical protein